MHPVTIFSDTVRVSTSISTSYPVVVGPAATFSDHLRAEALPTRRVIVISDENVWSIHGDSAWRLVREYWEHATSIVLRPGESMKAIERLAQIYDRAFEVGIDRDTVVVAIGGGVVGDLAGFAAATLLRGLPLVHVPTSMIAQVDSSIGGKTGINHESGKNLIGAFYNPRLVLTDPAYLQTLPEREYASGLAEVVKHSLIADAHLAEWLDQHWVSILRRDHDLLSEMIERASAVKVGIVQDDLLEQGRRAILNFGHTFGHAIERVAGYGTFTHGEAVAVGMRAAVHVSSRHHPKLDAAFADRLIRRIPVEPDPSELHADDLLDAMSADKKSRDGRLRFVCLESVGRAVVDDDIPREDVLDAIDHAKTA